MESLPKNEQTRHALKELERIESIIGSVIGLFWGGSLFEMIEAKDRPVVTRFAIKELFISLTLIEPIIILLEDLQWIDAESQETFQILTRMIEDVPLIVLATSRFNDDGTKPTIKTDGDIKHREIVLGHLAGDDVSLLIGDRLGLEPDETTTLYVTSRTDGNPFYAEQFCLYLKENDYLDLKDNQYVLTKEPTNIPTNINQVLIARIDRLSAQLKETVQIASVLGREFELSVLQELLTTLLVVDEDVIRAIKDEDVSPLISQGEAEKIWSALSEIRYIFSHALLRDAVYEMQLKTRLRQLHKLAGDILVRLYPGDDFMAADITRHYEKAEELELVVIYAEKAYTYFSEKEINYDEALLYAEAELESNQKLHGENHLMTTGSYTNVSDAYSAKGDYEMAMVFLQKALANMRMTFGEEHAETAKYFHYVGSLFVSLGDYAQALDFAEKSLSIREKKFGQEHKETANSYNNIGTIYQIRGDYNNALTFLERALKIREKTLDEDDIDLAVSYNNLGGYYNDNDRSKLDLALTYHEKALTIFQKRFGEEHPKTAICYEGIGNVYCNKFDFDKSFPALKKTLAIFRKYVGEVHDKTGAAYYNIGYAFHTKGDYGQAAIFYERALDIFLKVLGKLHINTGMCYESIGLVNFRNGDYDLALSFHQKGLTIFQKAVGDNNPNTINAYLNIGGAYANKGCYDSALPYIEKALALFKKNVGEEHPGTATSYGNLGWVLFEKGDFDRALVNLQKAHPVHEMKFGNEHPNTLKLNYYLARTYIAKDRFDEAQARLEKAYSLMERIMQPNDPHILKTLEALIELHQKTGDKEQAAKYKQLLKDAHG